MNNFRAFMGWIGTAIDAIGVVIILVGAILAVWKFLFCNRQIDAGNAYSLLRTDLGRAILLGLEFLIAGDIIRTVVLSPTIRNVAVLGGIVLIRTFLSITLQLEIESRWPWQKKSQDDS